MKNKILFTFFTLISMFLLTGCEIGSKDLIETIKSPDGKYEIKTYLHNCGATCDFGVSADLCNSSGDCKEIYNVYHESISFVYWIDEENIFINQKELNIFNNDKYKSVDYDNAFRLSNIDYYKAIYLIDKNNYEYKLSGIEADYIENYSTGMFNFDSNNIYNKYDFLLRIITIDKNINEEYQLVIDNNNNIYLIKDGKTSELNRTDYEFIKKILIKKDLYTFD